MSKRPTSTRGGMSRTASSASVSMPPPSRIPNRPPSAISQSTTSNRDDNTESRPSSPNRRLRKANSQSFKGKDASNGTENGEINIQVVVRCRGRSAQEVSSASPIITTTTGAVSKAITVETTPMTSSSLASFTTASSYGGSHQPMTKTYPFDKVFGPEADQTMIFNEVADGMLDEVLAGYNCTIFAYGQTGTGKTYTMQGDLELTPLLAPKSTAGIVPRVLHRLFSVLEATANAEFSVKCSYVELYNEELRDLLATEYKGESSSTSNGGLKLYEDGKKGVNIQGLEETGVRNLKEALGMLERGVKRRQTAETKMNTESSRSHTIFSITVHVKESSISRGGEDMLRIGKFNLVDLAGSEAIGRSGATDKRAREAGMINQSLLTLGRVISALVEKGSHIPYRESKLTRLLQDSLGGRTKTCIVATVSPTRSNMEETLSTLDYAIRAKSIRNRPEVNAHLTKTGLLKEYTGDIERLKNELLAAREKNGIYIPEDQWKEMQELQIRQKSDYDEAKLKASIIEVELQTRKKEFDEITTRFIATSEELAQVKIAEKQLTDLLEITKIDLEKVKIDLEEETIISNAYQKGEERLDKVAIGLKKTAQESVNDVGGLFDKLARKAKVFGSNADSATKFGGELQGLSTDLRGGLSNLQNVHESLGKEIQEKMQIHALKGQEMSQMDIQNLDKSFSAFTELAKKLSASNDKGQKEALESSKAILAVKEEVQGSVRDWAKGVSERSKGMVDDLLEHQQEHLNTVASVLGSTADLVDAVLTTTLSHLQYSSSAAIKSRDLALQASSNEISRLQTQNGLLIQLLFEEKEKSTKLRTELIGNLTSMIEGFTEQQDQSWSNAINKVTKENEFALNQMNDFSETIKEDYEQSDKKRKQVEDDMRIGRETGTRQREAGQEALNSVRQGLQTKLEEYGNEISEEADTHVRTTDVHLEKINKSAQDVSGKSFARGKKNSDLLNAITNNISQTHQSSKSRLSRISNDIEDLSSTLLLSSSTASATFNQSNEKASSTLEQIMQLTGNFLENGIKDDLPTGITPKKKNWNIINHWERTGNRSLVLENWRNNQLHSSSSSGSASSGLNEDISNSYGTVNSHDEKLNDDLNHGDNEYVRSDINGNHSESEHADQEDLTSSRESLKQKPIISRSNSREPSITTSIPISNVQTLHQPKSYGLSISQSQNQNQNQNQIQHLRQPSNSGLIPMKGKSSINGKKLNGGLGLNEERPNIVVLGEGVGVNVPRRGGKR